MSQIDTIVAEVLSRLQGDAAAGSGGTFPAEMSARHVHLSKEDLKTLFGLDQLERVRDISQPGQFLSGCRVRLIGPKGILDNVAVLGPIRGATQVEISATDARTLGIGAPVCLSGDLKDAAEIILQAGGAVITRKAAIVARRHVHMTPADAAAFGVANGECVSVRVLGSRPLILEQVPVRVSDQSALALHMDTDEANAAGAGKDCLCQIIGKCAPSGCSAGQAHAPENNDRAPTAEGDISLPGKLITEHDVRQLKQKNAASLCIRKGQIITPLARDTAKALGIVLICGGE
ncbi:MAG: phosphate propanoyltransferase [Clostridia bacterium]|nr:phosphate propanoyltransferase [Clostridia bacterium]